MGDALYKVLIESLHVTALVFLMMVTVDLLNVFTHGKLTTVLRRSRQRQYMVAPLLATVPGCLGMFTNVSLYLHGLIGFGALTGGMIAGSGDEAFVMLSMFPRRAASLFLLLFICGTIFGWLVDRLVPVLKIRPCESCPQQEVHAVQQKFAHYLIQHVCQHIIRRHLLRTFLWTLGALFIVELGLHYGMLQPISSGYTLLVLLLGGVVGLIPESGPHLIFVTMFAKGLIPFSVLFTSSFVQDGHGTLPLLSYSFRDFIWVKAMNLVFGLAVGLMLYGLGL